MLITPKTLDDARSLIENTVISKGNNDTWLNKLGLHGLQEAINNFNKVFLTFFPYYLCKYF